MITSTTRTVWNKTNNMPPKSAVKSHQMRSEVTSFQEKLDISSLKPGQYDRKSLAKREDKVDRSTDDRLTFSNGGSIEDKPNEGGLLLTYPDGTKREMPGWIDAFREEPIVHFKIEDKDGDWNTWSQDFRADGGVQVSVDTDGLERLIEVSAKGQVNAEASDYGSSYKVAGRVENQAVILESQRGVEAIVPPVPMDWILA